MKKKYLNLSQQKQVIMNIIGISCINKINRAIGQANRLLFHLKHDMKFFKNTTIGKPAIRKQNAVLMGSNTYFSIPKKFRPLEDRVNLIISNNNYNKIKTEINTLGLKNTHVFSSIDQSVQYAKLNKSIQDLYVIGGESIYNHFVEKDLMNSVYLTEVEKPKVFLGDTFFPELSTDKYKRNSNTENHIVEHSAKMITNNNDYEDTTIEYHINEFVNLNHKKFQIDTDETQYLAVLEDVMKTGEKRQTRNATVLSKFGLKMEFDIRQYFPLLTTKSVYWKGVVSELLWFLQANTNSKILDNQGVKIWNGNTSREYLDSIGLTGYKEGWCGPIYGFQWRHFNAPYQGPNANYDGKGVDQLQTIIDQLIDDPSSRRLYMSGWNPEQMDEMALPPCHVSYQFYVTNNGELQCQMYQRSGDLFLGIPFNIASTALLTNMVANVTGLKPGKIILVVGDAHIYEDHVISVKKQLEKEPYVFPTLDLGDKKTSIDNFSFDDFDLRSYYKHPTIKAPMIP